MTWPATVRVEEMVVAPVIESVPPILDEALEIKPERKRAKPKTSWVPDTETLPLESTEKRPRALADEVATLKELAVRVEVVVPSVTWKMLGLDKRPLKEVPLF